MDQQLRTIAALAAVLPAGGPDTLLKAAFAMGTHLRQLGEQQASSSGHTVEVVAALSIAVLALVQFLSDRCRGERGLGVCAAQFSRVEALVPSLVRSLADLFGQMPKPGQPGWQAVLWGDAIILLHSLASADISPRLQSAAAAGLQAAAQGPSNAALELAEALLGLERSPVAGCWELAGHCLGNRLMYEASRAVLARSGVRRPLLRDLTSLLASLQEQLDSGSALKHGQASAAVGTARHQLAIAAAASKVAGMVLGADMAQLTGLVPPAGRNPLQLSRQELQQGAAICEAAWQGLAALRAATAVLAGTAELAGPDWVQKIQICFAPLARSPGKNVSG
ncbi:hypothetical protein ABPG75_011949, partial [Micractinium tetrahymenae]